MTYLEMLVRKRQLERAIAEEPHISSHSDDLSELEDTIREEEERRSAQPLEPLILNLRPEDLSKIIRAGLTNDMGFGLPKDCGDVLSVTEKVVAWGSDREPTQVFQFTIERKKEPS